MLISLKVGGTYYPLAGQIGVSERTHSSTGGLRLTAAVRTQVLDRVRAATAATVDRGNLATTVAFTTTRLFATPAAAELYSTDYDAAIPREGTLVMWAVSPAGLVTSRHLLGAVVMPPVRTLTGCTLQLDYTATGAGIIAGSEVQATGTITVTTSITGYTFSLGGVSITSPTFASEAPSVAALRIVDDINANFYGGVTASAVAGVVTIRANAPGTAGNAITLTVSSGGLTASGATLTGGAN